MKKSALFSVLFTLFSIICSLPGVFAQSSDFGVILELTGTVELKSTDASSFVLASVGDQVWNETVISTDFRSSVLIEVGSTILTVRPLTRLTFTEIRASEGLEILNVNLQAGRLRVDIDSPAGTRTSLDVASPVAVASVRGTSFDFDTQTLIVNSGTVSFRGSAGQSVGIRAGSRIEPGESGRARNPATAGSSALRPSPPSGVQPNTAPAPLSVQFSEGQDSGDAGFEFNW